MIGTVTLLEGIPKRPGIYMIVNTISGKFYIGSSKSLRSRVAGHIKDLRANKHANNKLQHAWNLYGEDKFEYVVVEECETTLLFNREQFWLDTTKATTRGVGYNLVSTAGGGWSSRANKIGTAAAALVNKGKPRSAEVREKIGAKQKGVPKTEAHKANAKRAHWSQGPNAAEIIERSAAGHRGKKHTEEHKAKIGASHWKNRPDAEEIRSRVSKAGLGRKFTEEQRLKISKAAIERGVRQRKAREEADDPAS